MFRNHLNRPLYIGEKNDYPRRFWPFLDMMNSTTIKTLLENYVWFQNVVVLSMQLTVLYISAIFCKITRNIKFLRWLWPYNACTLQQHDHQSVIGYFALLLQDEIYRMIEITYRKITIWFWGLPYRIRWDCPSDYS